MPLLETDPGALLTDYPAQFVEVSSDIENPQGWQVQPYLWCQQLRLAANAYDEAILRYEIGEGVMQPGATAFGDFQPLSLRGLHVRVTIEDADNGDIVWYGYVLTDEVQRDGVKGAPGEEKFQGQAQLFQVVGLEYFLDRQQVTSAVIYPSTEIRRALKFNGGESNLLETKLADRGNRSTALTAENSYAFASDPTNADVWTAANILTYLLTYHAPTNSIGDPAPCEFVLDADDILSGYLGGIQPTLGTENLTVFQLLNKIAAPQRGLCWWLEFAGEGDLKGHIRIRSLATEAVSLPSGGTLPANEDLISLEFDEELDVKQVGVKNLGQRNYDRIICRGARQTCTLTVGMPDGTLVEDWKTETEDAYKDAASGDGDYAGLTLTKKKARNDAMRLSDFFYRVYAAFRIPTNWDGRSGDGNTAELNYALADLNDAGGVVGSLPFTAAGLRMLNRTRLKKGWDYSTPETPIDKTPTGSLPEFMAPFAFIQVSTSTIRWQYVDKLHEPDFGAGTRIGPRQKTSYHLRTQDHTPGIIVAAAGAPQHTIALNHFDPTPSTGNAEPTATQPELDYDTLRATVCVEADAYAQGQYEVNPLPTGVPIQELVIDCGDNYRLDYLADNTVVDIQKGVPILASTDAVLRDDRAQLRDLAKIAFEWYRQDRNSMRLDLRQLRNIFRLGQLVTTIGEGTAQSTLNTVVSAITYTLDKPGTMLIETHDDSFDVRALLA